MYRHYLALGDSMSIDLYPALDVGQTEVAVALERDAHAGGIAPLGAASLLHENDDERWPEFAGRDLARIAPGARLTNLTSDGATIGEVFGYQLPEIAGAGVEGGAETLVTLTVGGNDLLSAFANRPAARLLGRFVEDIVQAYDYLVEAIAKALPGAALLLTTVYDPTDGTGVAPGLLDGAGPLPLQHLERVNDHVRELAARVPGARLADVHARFLGHGVTAPEPERFYWRRSLIEPSALGASEIRRVWLEAAGL
ncbi:MAG TPA: GDSL-type esterase/lipase family protein [Gemmatimonadaceae bacterium]|nr:GDSL-type esterase/lipase family protein [Gemmatimonadaceae bacterium]